MTTKDNHKVRVAALGDLHTHESSPGAFRELFGTISEAADVLVLCGDLTNTGQPKEAELLAEDLKVCRIPVVGVLGNHDHERGHADEVKKVMRSVNMIFLDDETFKFKQVAFAGVKGFGGGFDKHMLASFGEEPIKKFVAEAVSEALALETQLQALNSRHAVVALHYSPITQTVHGEPPEVYPFLGCSRLAETIDRFEVAGVFHGHAHHGSLQGQTTKGTPVYNCCVEVLKARHAPLPYAFIEI